MAVAIALSAAIGAVDSEGVPSELGLVELVQIACAAAVRRAAYAVRRVVSLAGDVSPKVHDCGTGRRQGMTIACGCRYFTVDYTCRQSWLCWRCRKTSSKKRERKLGAALDRALASESARFERDADVVRLRMYSPRRRRERRRRYGGLGREFRHLDGVMDGGFRARVRILFATVAVRHDETTTIAECHERIHAGVKNLRKRYHERWGRYPYAHVWEVTPGADGLGHVHAHIALIIPWRDYKVMRSWFIAGAGGPTWCERVNFSDGWRRPGDARNRPKRPSTGRSAAKYLAKYISKGVDVDSFTHELRADVSAAFYQQRAISTGRYFWLPVATCCDHCGEDFARVVDAGLDAPTPHVPRGPPLGISPAYFELRDTASGVTMTTQAVSRVLMPPIEPPTLG